MKTQSISIKLTLLGITTLLLGCEPPTPGSQSSGIPEYTRNRDMSNWQARTSALNVWGLPVISRDKAERMPAIGRAIASKNIDVMMMEEAWLQEGRDMIAAEAHKPNRYDVTFKGAPLDSGIMFLSNTSILRTSFRPYQLFGPVILPDAWAVKGIGMMSTELQGLPISFFSTHMMAGLPRFSNTRSPFTPEWKGEMFELLTHLIEQTDSDAFILGGDFNIHFGDEEYGFWKRLSSLEGTLLEEKDGTCTWCKENVYAKTWQRQIDYIFVSPRLHIDNVWVDYKNKIDINGSQKNLSDHYGLIADIKGTIGDSQKDPNRVRQSFRDALFEVKKELEDYHKEKMADPEEQQQRANDIQTDDLSKRMCLTCRIEETLKNINNYEQALDATPEQLTPEQAVIRVRLESYFELFR